MMLEGRATPGARGGRGREGEALMRGRVEDRRDGERLEPLRERFCGK